VAINIMWLLWQPGSRRSWRRCHQAACGMKSYQRNQLAVSANDINGWRMKTVATMASGY